MTEATLPNLPRIINRGTAALLLILLLGLLSACAAQTSEIPIDYRWASVEGSQIKEARAGEQFYFNIQVDEGLLRENEPVRIKLSGTIESGSLQFELRQPDGQTAWQSQIYAPGNFSLETAQTLPAGQTGTYTLGLKYSENTSASYNLGWRAFRLSPLVLFPGAGMVLVSLLLVFVAYRRGLMNWGRLGLGALFWVLTVAAKFAFAIPVNQPLFTLLGVSQENLFSPANLLAYIYIGALTGVFEAGLAWLILRKSRWASATWEQALSFGIGFGVVEAFLLGLAALGSASVGLLSAQLLPLPALANLATTNNLLTGFAPVLERLSVIAAHTFACVLIFLAIRRGEARWGWLAIIYKTLLDAPAGFASFWGADTAGKIWTLEGIILVFGLIGLWGTLQVAKRYRQTLPQVP